MRSRTVLAGLVIVIVVWGAAAVVEKGFERREAVEQERGGRDSFERK